MTALILPWHAKLSWHQRARSCVAVSKSNPEHERTRQSQALIRLIKWNNPISGSWPRMAEKRSSGVRCGSGEYEDVEPADGFSCKPRPPICFKAHLIDQDIG